MIERVVAASTGGWDFVSTAYRVGPLAARGCFPVDAVAIPPFPADDEVEDVAGRGGKEAVVLLQRVLPTRGQLERLREAYRSLAFDFDDAIYAVPPALNEAPILHAAKRVARALARGSPTASSRRRPLVRVLGAVDVAVAGNEVLAAFARRHSRRAEVVPTTVTPVAGPPDRRPDPPVVVWMGLPDNLQHLRLVEPALRALANEIDFRLRIVSSRAWGSEGIRVEHVPWSPERARGALLGASVGIAPLSDDPWTRGKCAFRAIQYGGHALACVASPVGITDRVVIDGKTGFLARGAKEWAEALRRLLTDPGLADEMGRRALEHVRDGYSDDVSASAWERILSSL